MKDNGIRLTTLQDFSLMCELPHKYGKVAKEWLAPARLKEQTFTSFASILLTIIPIIEFFLEKFDIARVLPREVALFKKLSYIIAILRLGPEDAMKHIQRLKALIEAHHNAFIELYPDFPKPKMHHLHHVWENMQWLGKLMSCFVTERKHRAVKAAAIHVFRHLEHTVLSTIVNASCQQLINGHDLYAQNFLAHPRDVPGGLGLQSSTVAVLRCGEVARGDIVITVDGNVGRVMFFWKVAGSSELVAEVDVYACVGGNVCKRSEQNPSRQFWKVAAIVDACTWYYNDDAFIIIALPPAVLFP